MREALPLCCALRLAVGAAGEAGQHRAAELPRESGDNIGAPTTSLNSRRALWGRLVVVLERRAHVHALESLELLETLDTAPNARGVCALTVCAQPCLLALPSSAAGGALRIHNLLAGSGGGVLSEVVAHRAHVVRARARG
jgi:hypothetical protein